MTAPRAVIHGLLVSLVLLLAAAPGAVAAEADGPGGHLDGLPIVRIVCIRNNIFDTSRSGTSSWPYRAANALHTVTREGFIRSMLLFEEGDPYSAPAAAESARLLRSLGFLNPVHVTPRQVGDGLRGWAPDYFDGTGRAIANLQWRTLVWDDFLHLLSLGAVVFVDAGHT